MKELMRVTESRELCPGTRLISLEPGGIAGEAQPGQFVHISCGLTLRRPISICRASEDGLSIAVETRGEGTARLAASNIGDTLDVLGPLGRGFRLPEGRISVVGGGLGVPPLLFAALSARGGADAVLGFRDKTRLILTDEFESVCDKVYITTDDGSFGEHGAVTLPLGRMLKSGGYDAVLACGPRPMLRAVSELCRSVDTPCQVSMEERMGCGVGACLVCSCKTSKNGEEHMSRVCKDGPVFDAEEVCW